MKIYKCLSNKQIYQNDMITMLPIRVQDKYDIMKWRNEQIFHLRQDVKLTKQMQDSYFKDKILPSFDEENPSQILFSVLKDKRIIGYGGLVHIDWINQNAEISFLMDTQLEEVFFEVYWESFLHLLTRVAFDDLGLNKIYVYSFDLRPLLYKVLENQNFKEEARLRNHRKVKNNYVDVRIHSKLKI
jgi:RimJ/RimL family protein N-acetyltransferase